MPTASTEPTYFSLNAREFNGTTPLTTAFSPAGGLNPRYSVDQTTIGRLGFASLLRPGSHGAFISVRACDAPSGVIRIRSVSAGETSDDPEPRSLDKILEEVALTTKWSPLLHIGPTDAVCPIWAPEGGGTLEIVRIDAQADSTLAWANAKFKECCEGTEADEDNDDVTILEVDDDTTLEPWTGDLYVMITAPAQVTLAPVDQLVSGARAFITRMYADDEVSSDFLAAGGDTLNGATNGVVELGGQEQAIVEVVDGGYVSTAPVTGAFVHLTNVVAGTSVPMPPMIGRFTVVQVDFVAPGVLTLGAVSAPALAGAEYLILRSATGGAQAVLTPIEGSRINGRVNGKIYLGSTDAVRVKSTAGAGLSDWFVTGGSIKDDEQIVAAGNVVLTAWGKHLRIVRLTEAAAAQGVTLPPLADCPTGAELLVVNEGSVAGSIGRAGAPEVIVGLAASGNSVAVPVNTVRRVVAGAVKWLVT